jgi:hypothetical protein
MGDNDGVLYLLGRGRGFNLKSGSDAIFDPGVLIICQRRRVVVDFNSW